MIIALIYVDMPNRLAQPDFPTLNPERHCFPRPVTFDFASRLAAFREFGKNTRQVVTQSEAGSTPTFVNEFWTARQRQACSLHEVSYRACFKPQLPRFFIERLTQPGDVVYDPFMGRGTTPIEAALLGRVPWGNDINPISLTFTRPRLRPPTLEELVARLKQFNLADHDEFPEDLLAFYHPETLREICALKKYFQARRVAHGASVSSTWPTSATWCWLRAAATRVRRASAADRTNPICRSTGAPTWAPAAARPGSSPRSTATSSTAA